MNLSCALALCLSVTSVTDGDTFRSGELRVRLWGIDAPERDHAGGPAATAALTAMIDGRHIVCWEMDIDRYGRTVARCEIGGEDVACVMVSAGHARDWPRYSGGAYRGCE